MKTKIIVLSLSLIFSGCLPDFGGKRGEEIFCMASAIAPTLEIDADFPAELPDHLSFALNGEEIDYDQCERNQQEYRYDFFLVGPRTARFTRSLDNSGDVAKYFDENGRLVPGETVDLVVYGRDECADAPVEILRAAGVQINWNDPNADTCQGGSYYGVARIR